MRRAAIVAALIALGAPAAHAATWTGSYQSGGDNPAVTMVVDVRGGRATVVLPGGHARAEVAWRATPRRIRFTVPGRPGIAFDGRRRGTRVTGSFRQGAVRGTFTLVRRAPTGAAAVQRLLGSYTLADGRTLVVTKQAASPRPRATLLPSGETRGLYPLGGSRFAIGAAVAVREPSQGTAAFAADGSSVDWAGVRGQRVRLRQQEVRVGPLAGTLSLPAGAGPFPAVTFAHGGGEAPREQLQFLAAAFARHGYATLVYDKRGVGQSGDFYFGDAATQEVIDQYARDVERLARFVASLPGVDRSRVGVSGGSQAGWIMPLAASREPAIRFVVGLVPPTISQGQTDYWAQQLGQGGGPPRRPLGEVEDEARAMGPRGFDPMPAIRALRIPVLWLFGGNDLVVPTRLCVEALEPVTREPGRDFSYAVFPGGNHGLLQTASGQNAEADASSTFVPGLFTTIDEWLRARGLAR